MNITYNIVGTEFIRQILLQVAGAYCRQVYIKFPTLQVIFSFSFITQSNYLKNDTKYNMHTKKHSLKLLKFI